VWSARVDERAGARANACECIHVARTGGEAVAAAQDRGAHSYNRRPVFGHTHAACTRVPPLTPHAALSPDDHYTTATATTPKTATKFTSVSDKCADKHATFAANRRIQYNIRYVFVTTL